jgi:hypothetical protein
MISPETIIEFQQAVRTEYDKNISFEEASEILCDLVAYFDMLQQMEAAMPRAP